MYRLLFVTRVLAEQLRHILVDIIDIINRVQGIVCSVAIYIADGVWTVPPLGITRLAEILVNTHGGGHHVNRIYLAIAIIVAERVAAMRKAFAAVLSDGALLADAQKVGLDIGPMNGDELQALVARLYGFSPQVIERAKRALVYKGPAR